MKKEYILCSAIWYKDFEKPVHSVTNLDRGVVMCGLGHVHIIHQHVKLMGKRQAEMGDYEQGFLTSKNRFLSRDEAGKLAFEAGQIDVIKTLYSEDLFY